jgi:hypothetical protein
MPNSSLVLLLLGLLLPASVLAKGDGIGLRMEGTVSNLKVDGEKLSFTLTGRFYFEQYLRGTERQAVEVDGRRGLPVTVVQAEPFFAVTPDRHGAALRPNGTLARILRAAVDRKRVVKFELTDAKLEFGPERRFVVAYAEVIRATDADLR